jgi:hypothetical protein
MLEEESLRILSNALRFVHRLLLPVTGPEKFTAVLISTVNAG